MVHLEVSYACNETYKLSQYFIKSCSPKACIIADEYFGDTKYDIMTVVSYAKLQKGASTSKDAMNKRTFDKLQLKMDGERIVYVIITDPSYVYGLT